MTRKRLKKHKQSGMRRRSVNNRRPLPAEEKEARKKKSEAQRVAAKAKLAK
jgi:hypothetical protein